MKLETNKPENQMDNTLTYYNNNANEFVTGTVNADVSDLYSFFLKHLPPAAHILDLGCGSGRDSKYFLENGYSVCAIDGSEECCKMASELIGQEVICRTFENIDYNNVFEGIWACASILHVPSKGLTSIFKKISAALKNGGYLYASFKYGNFEGNRNGRYFTDLTEDKLNEILAPIKELKMIATMVTGDVRVGRENEKWLNVIIKKQY